MLLNELKDTTHPFNFAYPVQNVHDVNTIKQAYAWAAKTYGSTAPMPDVFVVNHEHMQHAAQRADHHTILSGQVFGWYSQRNRSVYLSDRIKPSRTRLEASILVHEFIHYMQDVDDKPNNVDELEQEADHHMDNYIRS